MPTLPPVLQKVLLVIVILLAATGIILSATLIGFAWAYNTPVTDSLARVAEGTERVLTAADTGLTVVNSGLNRALGAVNTIDGAARAAGDRIVETNIAFMLLERTVGDTLFPRIVAAQETVAAVADTVIGINDALEAANRLPFVEVPTLTTELQTVAGRLSSSRERVEEIQDGIRAIKEEKVSRPVSFVTDRTGRLITELDAVLGTTTAAQTRVNVALERLAALRARLPRLIDLISLALTLLMLWFIGLQGYALIRAYEKVAGKRIAWERLARRGEGIPAAAGAADGPAITVAGEPDAATTARKAAPPVGVVGSDIVTTEAAAPPGATGVVIYSFVVPDDDND